MWVQSLGQEDALEEAMATHSSIHAWRIPWTEEPGRLQSMGSHRVGHHWSNLACTHTHGHAHTHTHAHLFPLANLDIILASLTWPDISQTSLLHTDPWTLTCFQPQNVERPLLNNPSWESADQQERYSLINCLIMPQAHPTPPHRFFLARVPG